VIGVVADVKQSSLRETVAPQMYVPYTQSEIQGWPPMRTMQVALRTAADPETMIARVRNAIHDVDPALPLAKIASLKDLVNESMSQTRFAMLLLGAFGALALVLASVGMYGVISYFVAQRTQEIGIRMALGAARATVFGMVLSQGARLAAAGIAIGSIGALVAVRTLSTFLYNVRPADPLTFGAVGVLLGVVALLACYVPARRAARVDPVIALRNE
jgi:putative ABC transport system permease protein